MRNDTTYELHKLHTTLTQRSLTESIWSLQLREKKKLQRRRESERAHQAAETIAEK